jgi:hypothetical protein
MIKDDLKIAVFKNDVWNEVGFCLVGRIFVKKRNKHPNFRQKRRLPKRVAKVGFFIPEKKDGRVSIC